MNEPREKNTKSRWAKLRKLQEYLEYWLNEDDVLEMETNTDFD